jgi:formylglycine-generating enzyme required for sulfatase activity
MSTFTDPTTGMEFVKVPGSKFLMGHDDFYDSRPSHWVYISSFWLGKFPITNQEYKIFTENANHREPDIWCDQRFSGPYQPVVGVSWHDAVDFCEWLSKKSGKNYCLPSEAQWEYAARGTDGRRYPWGNEAPDSTRALFIIQNKLYTMNIGSFPAGKGPFDIFDQAGNVWEWCQDVYNDRIYKTRENKVVTDPVNTKGDQTRKVIRGGSYANSSIYSLHTAWRSEYNVSYSRRSTGFRVALIDNDSSTHNNDICSDCGGEGERINGAVKCRNCWLVWY